MCVNVLVHMGVCVYKLQCMFQACVSVCLFVYVKVDGCVNGCFGMCGMCVGGGGGGN